MDKHAPTVTRRVTVRKCELWYNNRIREQKKKVRHRERVWRKYVEDHQWKAYAEERNRLNRMIFANKQETFRNKVQECGKDTKKLYQLMNNMCGTVKQNPMPETSSELALAHLMIIFFRKLLLSGKRLRMKKNTPMLVNVKVSYPLLKPLVRRRFEK